MKTSENYLRENTSLVKTYNIMVDMIAFASNRRLISIGSNKLPPLKFKANYNIYVQKKKKI